MVLGSKLNFNSNVHLLFPELKFKYSSSSRLHKFLHSLHILWLGSLNWHFVDLFLTVSGCRCIFLQNNYVVYHINLFLRKLKHFLWPTLLSIPTPSHPIPPVSYGQASESSYQTISQIELVNRVLRLAKLKTQIFYSGTCFPNTFTFYNLILSPIP